MAGLALASLANSLKSSGPGTGLNMNIDAKKIGKRMPWGQVSQTSPGLGMTTFNADGTRSTRSVRHPGLGTSKFPTKKKPVSVLSPDEAPVEDTVKLNQPETTKGKKKKDKNTVYLNQGTGG